MERLRAWFQNVSGMLVGMNRRERIFVFSAVVFIVVYALLQFVVIPLSGEQARLEQKLTGEKEELRQMTSLREEVSASSNKMHNAMTGLSRREANFTLFSFLDRLAGDSGVKDNITYMKPSMEESEQGNQRLSLVEMKLEAVNLENLVSYIYKIETAQSMVFVKRLSISRQEKDIGGVDAVMQVVTVAG